MYGGMGDTPDVFDNLEGEFSSIPNPFSTGANASNSISVTVPSGLTLNASGQVVQSQSFADWVNANSTLLLVAFAALGAVVALTRVGK
jgi:hypothetical protein